ncbi:hypothetical protein Cgig2_029231 [Carnegiea gigantea]|uniref:Reverse transcriptase zinc-binding domain-containing protein n=1 Tax=Carnegiea gigantea TaxID=171969 RepID=A0A9Q1GQX1_9CARY|nr:hypothetical protein Cgig2_029231 [Carnegiea gigantea]
MNPLSNENLHTSHRQGGVLDIKLFVWNVQSVGNTHFLNELKEHLRLHRPHILAVLETHISGDQANEAPGFLGDIWFLWNSLKTEAAGASPLYREEGILLCFRLHGLPMQFLNMSYRQQWKRDAPIALKLHELSIGMSKWNKEVFRNPLGIHAMRPLNATLLMKIGWRLITDPEAPWAQGTLASLNKTLTTNVSNAWRGVAENLSHVRSAVGMVVGDGRGTRFWLGRWAEPSPLLIFLTKYVPEAELEKRVCEYWSHREGWLWDKFVEYLPQAILQRMASFELMEEGDGHFSLKSAINIVKQEPELGEETWRRVWRVKATQRVKVFVWMALHDKVMTNTTRMR